MNAIEKARRGQQATLACLLLLMLVMAVETLLRPPPQLAATVFVIVLKLLPLALFIPALRQARAMSAVWLVLLLMLYFCWAVLSAYAPGLPGQLALLRLLLIAGCVVAAMLFTRWQRAADAASA